MNGATKGLQQPLKPLQFLVEGQDTKVVVECVLAFLGIDAQVVDFGGRTELRSFLRTWAALPGFHQTSVLGVIRDAEDDAMGAFQSAADALTNARLPRPTGHATFATGRPRTGVFVLPDGQRPGMLEDLCVDALPNAAIREC